MAQSEACDPRTEVLAGSRRQSGSFTMEGISNQPPGPVVFSGGKNSQFVSLRTRFEDSASEGNGHGSKTPGPLLGASVSKIKEKFQRQEDKGSSDVHPSFSSSSLPRSSKNKDSGDRSPDIKKMKVTDGQSHSLDSKLKNSVADSRSSSGHMPHYIHTPPLSPTHSSTTSLHTAHVVPTFTSNVGASSGSRRRKTDGAASSKGLETQSDTQLSSSEPSLLEATNHVQRFNYTRAMFARMEEETRRAQEREKIIRRKPSPSRPFPGNIAPKLSSFPVSFGQENKKLPATRERDSRRPKSMIDVPSEQMSSSESFKRLSDSGSSRESRREDRKFNQNANLSAQAMARQQREKQNQVDSSKDDQILRSRRPNRSPVKRDDSGDRSGKYFQSLDELKSLEHKPHERTKVESSVTDLNRDTTNKADSHLDGADRSSPTVLSSSPPPSLPHSSRLEHSIRPGYRARAQASAAGLSSSHSKTSDIKENKITSPTSPSSSSTSSTSVVRRQRKQISTDQLSREEEAKKRLSKEEIEAALERADTYLASLSSPEEEKANQIKKGADSSRQHSKAESAAARRQFLYGTDTSKPSPVTSDAPSDQDNKSENTRLQEAPEINETSSLVLLTSSASSLSSDMPQSSVKSTAVVTLKSPSSSNESLDLEALPDLPPPSYHEATDPPPYHEATSPVCMLISQKVFMSQQQNQNVPPSSAPVVAAQPIPIPRRIAPPLPKKPAIGNASDLGVPPPAPEPGSSEYIHELDSTPGVRVADMPDSEPGDDLILPEEHIARHNDLDLQNGEVDTTSFARTEFLVTRESGDGKEDSEEADAILSDGEPLEIDYGNLSYLEIPPISSDQEDDSSGDEISYHKPSRVCFSKSPIKVFATYSTNDYDRRNEDVDPVAASAEYELEKRVEKMDVFPVALQKGTEGLGFSIIGMGVGADAGLEKLGIFIKTLTPNGVAQRSQQVDVNDQIIEVDGKSLVGVTQAYAASVLRNTSGEVNFLIGREKDPSKSEVARLIQQSLEQDRRREEMREKEQQRLRHLEDSFQPKDEVLERHAHSHLFQQPPQPQQDVREDSESETEVDEKDGEGALERETSNHPEQELSDQERLQLEQETAAGDATPLSTPSNGEDVGDSSPELLELHSTMVVAVGLEGVQDKPGSSSDSLSPDMVDEKLFVKLKESQYKLAVAESEILRLKGKLVTLESSEGQKKQVEKKLEDLTRRFQERDKHYDALKKELSQYKDMMVASQSQHIELEKKVRELGALEKKYHKAKKLIKDYQLREKDFIQERESLLEQQAEKDQQYNSLVKSLKDRIFLLEKHLTDLQKAAGLPSVLSADDDIEVPMSPARPTPLVRTVHSVLEEPLSPLNQSTEDVLDTSTCSEISDSATSPVLEESFSIETALAMSSSPVTVDLGDSETTFPVTEEPFRPQLDSTLNTAPSLESAASRDRNNLNTLGSSSNRWSPTKKVKTDDSLEDLDSGSEFAENGSIHSSHADQAESGLDMWNKHDRRDSNSDSSSSVSQTSYDPSRPNFKISSSEIPDTATDDASTNSEGGVTLISAKASVAAKGFGIPKFNWKSTPRGGNSSGGVVLISNRPLANQHSASDPGLDSTGVSLASRKHLDTGFHDYDASSVNSDISNLMVSEPNVESSGKYVFNISGLPVTEDNQHNHSQNKFLPGSITDWSTEHVCHWLTSLDFDKYTASFREKNVTGSQLLHLDTSKLKTVGVVSSKDRETLKKKIKEMRSNAEREKKIQEKERKQKEKEQKKMFKKK
ncbi:hypothetical protein BsWGS_25085 [Bradybaena similaris]